jgi:outer membrane murein-binding lipoprotein Lpp
MKALTLVLVLLGICLVACVGCKKSGNVAPAVTDFNGVKVDWTKLDTEFVNSDAQVYAAASLAKRHIRYAQWPQALGVLEGLSANPQLTEAQKKVVSDLFEQTKLAFAQAPPPVQ